jgi:hypothetical protein
MDIEITEKGVYWLVDGVETRLAVGTVLKIEGDTLPASFANKARIVGAKSTGAVMLPEIPVAPNGLIASHRGGGKWAIMDGETVVAPGLSKDDAEAFNEMSADDKAAYVAAVA